MKLMGNWFGVSIRLPDQNPNPIIHELNGVNINVG